MNIQEGSTLTNANGSVVAPHEGAVVLPGTEHPLVLVGQRSISWIDVEQVQAAPVACGAFAVSAIPYLVVQVGDAFVHAAPLNTRVRPAWWDAHMHTRHPDRSETVDLALVRAKEAGAPSSAPSSPDAEPRCPVDDGAVPGTVCAIRTVSVAPPVCRSVWASARNQRRAYRRSATINRVIRRTRTHFSAQDMARATDLYRG